MIRTEKEYKAALVKLKQNTEALSMQMEHLATMNLSPEQMELVISPLQNFYLQLKQEIDEYERIKNCDWEFIKQLADLQHIGKLFIALRIAYGLTQRDLANLLGITEAQVSKDERNEYHGISLERAVRIMQALKIIPPHLELNSDLNKELLFK